MSEEMRTSWRDRTAHVTHGVTIAGLHHTDRATQYADDIRTDCGLVVPTVTLDGDGNVTCIICLESSWFDEVASGLEVEAPAAV